MKLYATRQDVIDQEIIPSLGVYATEYDIDAIADALIIQGEDKNGNPTYHVVDSADFWEVVENNAL